jgi:hypothetical protein
MDLLGSTGYNAKLRGHVTLSGLTTSGELRRVTSEGSCRMVRRFFAGFTPSREFRDQPAQNDIVARSTFGNCCSMTNVLVGPLDERVGFLHAGTPSLRTLINKGLLRTA